MCGVLKGTPLYLSIHNPTTVGVIRSYRVIPTVAWLSQRSARKGFSLVELLVLIATIAILSVFLFPGLSRAKEGGRKITCMNNIRQLGIASRLYADANNGWYPPRTAKGRWPTQLFVGYKYHRILKCPSDILRPDSEERDAMTYPADAAPRSYILNGWNDVFKARLGDSFSLRAIENKAIRTSDIYQPSMTVVFGEKRGEPGYGRFYMDLLAGRGSYDEQVERGRHAKSGEFSGEGSNYAFADGSAQFLTYGKMNYPMNLWMASSIPAKRTGSL